MICGGTISGNCASGSASIAIRPTMTVTIAMTMATIGRLMKNAEIMAYVLSYRAAVSEGAAIGFGLTTISGLTFWVPSATTVSPGLIPSSIIHIVSNRSPTLTVRMATLLSLSTTAT